MNQQQQTNSCYGPCPDCGTNMLLIAGSKKAHCSTCGYKDSCCY